MNGTLKSIGVNTYTDKFGRNYFWGRVIIDGEITESPVMIPMGNYLFVKVGTEIIVRRLPKSKVYEQSYVMESIGNFQQQVSLLEMLVELMVDEALAKRGE